MVFIKNSSYYKKLILQTFKKISSVIINKMEIDGSKLEGGGQILRMASSLSSILKIPVKVTNIRGNRSKPGLKAQHLTGLQLLRDLSSGKLEGDYMDSMMIDFTPGSIEGGKFSADTKTAGSVSLLIQSVLPCALFGKKSSSFTLRGGTNAEMAPQTDYTIQVFKKIASKFEVNFDLSINVRGFFPVGRGEIALKVDPLRQCLRPVEMLEQGEITIIKGFSFVAGILPIKVAYAMKESAESLLRQQLGQKINISISAFKEQPNKAVGNGSGIVLWAETSTGCILGSSNLGKRGTRAEEVGTRAAEQLIDSIFSKSCVDSYAQDQVVILMALASGKSRIRTTELTLHTQTAIHVAELMSKAKFNVVEDKENGTVILECDGVGLQPTG